MKKIFCKKNLMNLSNQHPFLWHLSFFFKVLFVVRDYTSKLSTAYLLVCIKNKLLKLPNLLDHFVVSVSTAGFLESQSPLKR